MNLGFWSDTPEAVKEAKARKLSRLPFPETGWRPPQNPPQGLENSPWLGIDTETYDPELDDAGPGWARSQGTGSKGHIIGVSLAAPGGKWYFPVAHELQPELNLPKEHVFRWLKKTLASNSRKIGAHLAYDIGWLKEEGIEVNGPLYDVQIAESLINETSEIGLEEIGIKHLGRGKKTELLEEWCLEAYKGPKTKWRKNLYRSPVSLVGPYAEDDAEMPYEILAKQWPILSRNGLIDLFEMECRLIRVFVKMRFQGIQVDVALAEKLYGQFEIRYNNLINEACHIAGVNELNVNAGDSLAKAFERIGLSFNRTAPTEGYPDGQPSFTNDFLKTIDHPLPKKIIEAKNLRKLNSTFLKSYIIENNVNSKIYCSFTQTKSDKGGTRTGRLASSDPNLQNIPIRTDEGKMIRECFIMDLGHKRLRDYDYSQIEYRMLAHYATGPGSDELRARFNLDPNLDYHNLVGDMIFDLVQMRLSRSHVKTVNFGIVYGVGIKHLAEMLGLSLEAAEDLLENIHKAIPFAKQTMDDLAVEVNRTGLVTTILGRQSHFDMWESTDWNTKRHAVPTDYDDARRRWGVNIQRSYLYRALNYKLQGSAAEILKKGMDICESNGIFDEIGVPRLQVHDELLFSDPGNIREEAWDEMKHVFETAIPGIKVPIRFDGSQGINWKEAH